MADKTNDLSKTELETKPQRDERGRLLPGNTANVKGLQRRIPEDVRDYLQHNTMKGARRLVESLDASRWVETDSGLTEVADHKLRREAAMAIFERLYGKPPQSITDQDGNPFSGAIILLPAEVKE